MTNQSKITLLVVDDDAEYRSVVAHRFERRGHAVTQTGSASEALRLAQQTHFDVAILDIAMPEMDGVQLLERLRAIDPQTQAIMLTGQATIETAIRAMKLGAFDYITKPCVLAELELNVDRAYEQALLARENEALRCELRRVDPPHEIIGSSAALRNVLRLIQKAAPSDSTVLIEGESGTGKELVARALHRGSSRAARPMVVINCAALQESLLESELFGHERGAFTSAVAMKQGLFELADRGTLFIDEIGEMSAVVQSKLLRALEDGRIRRLGSTREIHTDVRIIAATNRTLSDEVAAGRFRRDLYYRLNVISITLPPLRERREDIAALVKHFLQGDARGPHTIHPDAERALIDYDWPGNIRELKNVIERARILAEGPTIGLGDLPSEVACGCKQGMAASVPGSEFRAGTIAEASLELMERQHIERVIEAAHGNKAKAARELRITRRKLYRLLDRFAEHDNREAGASNSGERGSADQPSGNAK